jgi:hypothetical protein
MQSFTARLQILTIAIPSVPGIMTEYRTIDIQFHFEGSLAQFAGIRGSGCEAAIEEGALAWRHRHD